MRPPERSAERDAAIAALLPNVPYDGWTIRGLRRGLRDAGLAEEDAELLFPGGTTDMVEAYGDLADRWMERGASELGLEAKRMSERVRALVALRLRQNRAYKEAVRRALGVLSMPRHAGLAAAMTARTVDAIWHAAGDRSTDWSWYSKRATLASVYSLTVLFWLRDGSDDDAATLAFLDRRLAGIGRIGRLRGRAERLLRRRA